MFTKYRSFTMFKISACFVGVFFIVLSIVALCEGMNGVTPLEGVIVPIFFGIMGIGLIASAIIMHMYLRNQNAGKIDESIHVTYEITYQGKTQLLDDISVLIKALEALRPGEEISIHLNPEYFGLMDWKFLKIKNCYISFVWVRKKDKVIQHFLLPYTSVSEATKPFIEVFEKHKAIDTSIIFNMKKYQGVLEVYNLK